MKKINIAVTGITREEYYEAGHRNAKRFYKNLAIVMVIVCGIIIFLSQDITLKSVLLPILIYAVTAGGFEMILRMEYKDQLAHLEDLFYEFSPEGWKITMGKESIFYEWKKIPRIDYAKLSMYVYNDEYSSSMIPLHFISEEELAQIKEWFEGSREEAAAYDKMITEQMKIQMHNKANSVNPMKGNGVWWNPRKK